MKPFKTHRKQLAVLCNRVLTLIALEPSKIASSIRKVSGFYIDGV